MIRGFLSIIVGTLVVSVVAFAMPNFFAPQQVYGVSYSAPYARGLGLDARKAYEVLFTDLHVPVVRLMAYWNVIEPTDDAFDFTELDYQMDTAAEHNADVVLSVGHKLPRWPECHTPEWAKNIPKEEQQAEVLEMLDVVVNRYKDHPALMMWQVENEPLLDFGADCPTEDREFLQQEFDLIDKQDGTHPRMITDSGELNSWIPAAKYGDIVGTTMYRTVFSSRTEKPFSYDYIFPAWLYRAKARLVKIVRGKDVVISELQGEPWGNNVIQALSREEKSASFSPERFYELQYFAERSGFPLALWWGVEYWYWEKEINDYDAFWNTAREIFPNTSESSQ